MTTATPTSQWDDLVDQTILAKDYPPKYQHVLVFFGAILCTAIVGMIPFIVVVGIIGRIPPIYVTLGVPLVGGIVGAVANVFSARREAVELYVRDRERFIESLTWLSSALDQDTARTLGETPSAAKDLYRTTSLWRGLTAYAPDSVVIPALRMAVAAGGFDVIFKINNALRDRPQHGWATTQDVYDALAPTLSYCLGVGSVTGATFREGQRRILYQVDIAAPVAV